MVMDGLPGFQDHDHVRMVPILKWLLSLRERWRLLSYGGETSHILQDHVMTRECVLVQYYD